MNFFTTVSSHWFWRRWRVRWSTVSLWERHNWCSCCPAQKEIEWKIHFAQGKITLIGNLSSLFLVLMWRHGGHIGAQNNSEKKSLGTLILLLRKTWATFCHCFVHQFLVFTPVIRRSCWWTKQWQTVAEGLHNSQKTVLYTYMAAVTSRENREHGRLIMWVKTMNNCRWEYKVWISIQTDLQLLTEIYLQSTIQIVQHRFEGMRLKIKKGCGIMNFWDGMRDVTTTPRSGWVTRQLSFIINYDNYAHD